MTNTQTATPGTEIPLNRVGLPRRATIVNPRHLAAWMMLLHNMLAADELLRHGQTLAHFHFAARAHYWWGRYDAPARFAALVAAARG